MPEEEVRWTRVQQECTLAAIAVVREAQAGGPQYAASDAMREVVEALQRLGEPTDADGLALIVSGLTNTACLLLDWIEAEAQNKQLLLQRVRRSLPDFEEPDAYPTDPSWSSWPGVLRAVEKTVREIPLSD